MTTYISPIFATGQAVDAALTRALSSVQEGDNRLTDSRNPLPHTHPSAPSTQLEYTATPASGTLTLHPGNGTYQRADIPGDTTVVLVDPPAGEAGRLVLRYRVTGTSAAITWPANVRWLTTPVLATSGGTEGYVELEYGASGWVATAYSPGQTDWDVIKALPQMVGYWNPGVGVLTASGDTSPAAVGSAVGYCPDLSANGKNATQTTTANKPILRQTPTTRQYWLDADSTDALNITLPVQLTNAAVFRVTAEGITVARGQTVATTYNLITPFSYSGSIAIFNEALGALADAEIARITRYMSAADPRPLKGTNQCFRVAPQLSGQTNILSLASLNGKLYGGTYPNAKLFEWNGSNAWVEVAPQLAGSGTGIFSLAVYNGKLYGGTSPGGKLLEWNGSNAWVEVAPQLNSQTGIRSLAVFNGKLYGGTDPNGKLFEWNGVDAWIEVAPQFSGQLYIYSLAVLNGKLYGGTAAGGKLLEWNGTDAWVEVAPQLAGQSYIFCMAVFNGKIYGGTYPSAKLFEWNGSNAWVEVAPQLASQTYISSLAAFNGKLYGGTDPGGKLLEWNGSSAWVEVAPQIDGQTSIRSLSFFDEGLYGGTASSGTLVKWST